MTGAHRRTVERFGQLALPGFEMSAASTPIDTWFFAVRPTPSATGVIARLPERVQAGSTPGTRLIALRCMHVSLQGVDFEASGHTGTARRAREAAARVSAEAFALTFDRFATFGRGTKSRPFVLFTSDAAEGLRGLHRELGAKLAAAGVKHDATRSFAPHLTLAHGTQPIATTAIEPIRWIVDEFVLVRSLQGRGRHVIEGRWRLAAR
jgi:2'-5' RNA ligase